MRTIVLCGAALCMSSAAFAQPAGQNPYTTATRQQHRRIDTIVVRAAEKVPEDVYAFKHYGNLVTYMRLKGIVPPTSEPAK